MFYIGVFITIFTIASCEEEPTPTTNEVNIPSLWDVANLYKGDWDGYINIQGKKLFGDDPITIANAQNTAIAKFWDDSESTITMDNVMVGDVNLSSDVSPSGNTRYSTEANQRQTTKHLFGNTVNVSLINNNNESGNVEVYCPTELVINEPIRATTGLNSIGGMDRKVLLKWNADYNNDKGVGIAVSYSSKLMGNHAFGLPSMSSRILVDDDGEYTLSIDENIPSGAIITVYMIRGDMQGLDIKDKTYLSSCYSLTYAMFKVAAGS